MSTDFIATYDTFSWGVCTVYLSKYPSPPSFCYIPLATLQSKVSLVLEKNCTFFPLRSPIFYRLCNHLVLLLLKEILLIVYSTQNGYLDKKVVYLFNHISIIPFHNRMKSDNRSSRDRVKSPQRQINLRNESEEKTCQWRKQMSYQGNADQPWTTQKPKIF